jgi:nucleotide-binding universal stress UspA family protein
MSAAMHRPDEEEHRFDTLVVPHDLTPFSDRALPFVHQLGRHGHLAIHLVTTASPGLDTSTDRRELAARARRLHGWPATVDILVTDEPAAAIIDFTARHAGALICVPTHGRTAVGELVLGSMTADVLSGHRGPTIVVGPRVEAEPKLWRGLLVCIDEFAIHSPLLDTAMTWQSTFGGDLELLEVTNDDRPGRQGPPLALREAAAHAPGAKVRVIASRDPARAIVDEATATGKIIAVASHLRSGFERALLGSVTWEVIRFCPTPVLIVPGVR